MRRAPPWFDARAKITWAEVASPGPVQHWREGDMEVA